MNTAGTSLKSFISHFVIQGTAIFRARLAKWEGAERFIHLYKAAGFEIKDEDVEGLTRLLSEILPDPLTAAGLIKLFEYADDRDHQQLVLYLKAVAGTSGLEHIVFEVDALKNATTMPEITIFQMS